MALFTESQFASVPLDVPQGESGSPAEANSAVTLQLSDGSVATVFDKLTTGLKLLRYMRTNSQWQVAASDDILVVSVNAVKGLVMENTLVNQKLITSFLPIYLGDQVRFVHRTSSLVLSLTDALKSVGFCHTASTPFANNLDLRTAGAHMQLFDWYYQATPADSTSGTLLSDSSPIVYDFTA